MRSRARGEDRGRRRGAAAGPGWPPALRGSGGGAGLSEQGSAVSLPGGRRRPSLPALRIAPLKPRGRRDLGEGAQGVRPRVCTAGGLAWAGKCEPRPAGSRGGGRCGPLHGLPSPPPSSLRRLSAAGFLRGSSVRSLRAGRLRHLRNSLGTRWTLQGWARGAGPGFSPAPDPLVTLGSPSSPDHVGQTLVPSLGGPSGQTPQQARSRIKGLYSGAGTATAQMGQERAGCLGRDHALLWVSGHSVSPASLEGSPRGLRGSGCG